jgi:hypothetical protein
MVGSGHERALTPLLVLLLVWMVGGTFVGVIVLLCLALGAVEDGSNRLFTRGMAGGDVKELLGGPRTLATQLVDQGLIGGARQEGPNDVGIGDVRQLIALLGEALDVLAKSFSGLLLAVI